MNTDFLCERRLAQLNPYYSELVKNTAFVLSHTLEKYKLYFPEFTDHTILHSLQVIDFCNKMIAENVDSLNADEIYVLLMSAYLHDCGMGITQEDYKELYDVVVSDEYKLANPQDNIKETIRSFHQTFSKRLIYKYGKIFDIPSQKHIEAIAIVSDAHRKINLFDENRICSEMYMDNGNVIHLPYLAALIRLADELDIAADRNIGIENGGKGTVFHLMHKAITHLNFFEDKFVLDVETNDPALLDGISKEIRKLEETLTDCVNVADRRTPFKIKQRKIETNRVHKDGKSLLILDTDLGTDDACALLLSKILPRKPDYIVASYGNASLRQACYYGVILKKYLGLGAKIVRGLPPPPDSPNAEKDASHVTDGLAGCADEMARALGICDADLDDCLPFDTLLKEIDSAAEVTYITIGTLTNLNALMNRPKMREKLVGIYIMGGGLQEFNCSNETEFNFSKDPKSVQNVLSSGLNVTLFPLDITNRQTLSREDIDRLEKIGSYPEYVRFLRHNLAMNGERCGTPCAVLHDTLPVLFLSHPECFTLKDMRVYPDEYGHTEISPKGDTMHVCVGVEEGTVKRFMERAFLNE